MSLLRPPKRWASFLTQPNQAALKATSGNLERAADWLFSHADDMDAAVAQVNAPAAAAGVGLTRSPSRPTHTRLRGPALHTKALSGR